MYSSFHPRRGLTLHDLRLLDAATLHGVQGISEDRHRQGHFLVARDGRIHGQAASLALGVEDGASVTLGTDADATKGEEARSAGLAAALHVQTANTGLSKQGDTINKNQRRHVVRTG